MEKHGFGREVRDNGRIYEGQFKDGKFDGFGRIIYNLGNYYVGEW